MAQPDGVHIGHLIVDQITFSDKANVVSPSAGVKGLLVTADGSSKKITPTSAPSTVTQSAGATYTSTEQAMLNALKAQLNSLISALQSAGHLQ